MRTAHASPNIIIATVISNTAMRTMTKIVPTVRMKFLKNAAPQMQPLMLMFAYHPRKFQKPHVIYKNIRTHRVYKVFVKILLLKETPFDVNTALPVVSREEGPNCFPK